MGAFSLIVVINLLNRFEMSGSCSVLMVCLGNICRSPIAEALLRHKWNKLKEASGDKLKYADLVVDSCGTAGYHIGSSPDSRGLRTMKRHGIETSHKCRKLKSTDGSTFDFIFAWIILISQIANQPFLNQHTLNYTCWEVSIRKVLRKSMTRITEVKMVSKSAFNTAVDHWMLLLINI